ncbi:MAG: hypothetical protein JNL82_27805 [Myxococcales bacterium]|nr:hypothetical protein [Myxococcales bacterium]
MPRTLVTLLACSLSVAPIVVHARPEAGAAATGQAQPEFDKAAFRAEYMKGVTLRKAGAFAEAARVWRSSARHMPETPGNRDHRAGLYNQIAEAFVAAAGRVENAELLQEAVATLDYYISGFEAAYPGEAASPEVVAARAELQRRLTALEARRPPPPVETERAPAPAPTPTPTVEARRPGRGLQIAGGVGFGLGAIVWLATLPAGYGKVNDAYAAYLNAGCDQTNASECGGLGDDYRAGERQAVAGWVTGSLLLAAGLSMFVVGTVRRSGRSTVTPTASATSIGLTWQGRF